MHAYLIIGQDESNIDLEIEKLSKNISAKIISNSLLKIDDVRNLTNLLRLSFNEPTLIVSKNIHLTGEEALNAFLKNLEEPQENIYFALTAPSEKSVLSTIISRCQIIKVLSTKWGTGLASKVQSTDTEKFINMTKSEKLLFLDKIKDRDIAISFINQLISFNHHEKQFTNMEILLSTLNNLKKNGIVSLHLTNLVVRMEST